MTVQKCMRFYPLQTPSVVLARDSSIQYSSYIKLRATYFNGECQILTIKMFIFPKNKNFNSIITIVRTPHDSTTLMLCMYPRSRQISKREILHVQVKIIKNRKSQRIYTDFLESKQFFHMKLAKFFYHFTQKQIKDVLPNSTKISSKHSEWNVFFLSHLDSLASSSINLQKFLATSVQCSLP